MVTFLWCAYDSYHRFTGASTQRLRIQELRGNIIYFDEVLTMSARMCACTGDRAWEDRYREHEGQLDEALRQALTSAPGAQTSKQTDEANAALVAMEHAAIDLAHQGKLEEARATLFSDAYEAQKAIYREGMDNLGKQIDEAASADVRREHRRIMFQLAGGTAIIAILVVGWIAMVRATHQGMRLRTQLDKVERDLDIAREIQRGLLPTGVPETPGFQIEGWSKPADQTGGDYFDWMALPDGGTLITIADVTGHGIGPALIVAFCRAYMRASAVSDGVALEEAITRVNDLLQVDLPPERFVTAAVGVLRPQANEMSLVSAGQGPMFFYRAASKTVESWHADDLPLGVAPGIIFDQARVIRFEPGDTLVLTTDGFFEWANDSGDMFGTQRLEAFIAAHAHQSPKQFIESLHAEVVAHASGRVQPDDLTVVIVKRANSNG